MEYEGARSRAQKIPRSARVAGNGKFRGRLDEVGNGNLGVPLLPTMPAVSRFRALSLSLSSRSETRAKCARGHAFSRTSLFGTIILRNRRVVIEVRERLFAVYLSSLYRREVSSSDCVAPFALAMYRMRSRRETRPSKLLL